jgi:hypothetical protein
MTCNTWLEQVSSAKPWHDPRLQRERSNIGHERHDKENPQIYAGAARVPDRRRQKKEDGPRQSCTKIIAAGNAQIARSYSSMNGVASGMATQTASTRGKIASVLRQTQ